MKDFTLKNGLDAFQIKILALIFMTFDHIHYMMTGVLEVPMWFLMLGRIAAPLFIFMVANGMMYTRSREKYILKLWIGSVTMNLLNGFFEKHLPQPGGAMLIANIFSTLFIITLLIYVVDKIKESIRNKQLIKTILYVLIGLIPFVSSVIIMSVLIGTDINPIGFKVVRIIMMTIPAILSTEGGFMFVILGLGFYLCQTSKRKQTVFYLVYVAAIFIMNMAKGITLVALFTVNIQWLMILALPFILLYNNNKGKGMKYLFYFYYPMHIYGLLILSNIIYSVK